MSSKLVGFDLKNVHKTSVITLLYIYSRVFVCCPLKKLFWICIAKLIFWLFVESSSDPVADGYRVGLLLLLILKWYFNVDLEKSGHEKSGRQMENVF